MTQLHGQLLISQAQMYQLKTEEILNKLQKYDADQDEDTPFDKKTMENFLKSYEQEQQTNPFTYDIALAFRKDLDLHP
jgi:hypothetical protein